jgi:hypothetical protein
MEASMRREFICGTVLATLVAAGVVAAQTPDQDRSPTSPAGARTVTVTGCLQSATAGGEQPNAGDASSRQFMLTNATMSGTGATGTAGATTSGTTGGAVATRAGATSFRLTGGGDSLQQYVNSRVEVTGTIQRGSASGKEGSQGRPGSSAGAAAGSSAGAGSTASSGQAGDQAVQTLRIASVKQVSESCSGEGR